MYHGYGGTARLIEIVMYSAYGDESRDDGGERVYAVSGVFGAKKDWHILRKAWSERLEGKVFHAADCEGGYGDFSTLKAAERLSLYRDLVTFFVNSRLMSCAGAINVRDYNEVFPKEFEHAPYLLLFGDIVKEMANLASISIPNKAVKITFDRSNVEYNATLLYDYIRRSQTPECVKLLSDEISFATRQTFGIQVADLIAREAMKHLDGELQNRRVRKSFLALQKSGRVVFRFFNKNDFLEKKRAMWNSPLREKATLSHYYEWLADHGVQDCLSNRVRHLETIVGTKPSPNS